MDCLANTGIDALPILIVGALIVGTGIYFVARSKKSRAGWGALIALPLLLAFGIATQPAVPAQAAPASNCSTGSLPGATAGAPAASVTPTTPATELPTPTPTPTPDGCQAVNDKSPVFDTDGDGIVDACDLDSDNDGIPDSVEDLNNNGRFEDDDTDGDNLVIPTLGDGVSAYLDLDSDNDSILDLFESGIPEALIEQIDTDSNGVIDLSVPVGTNGLADVLETSPDSGVINYTVKNTTGNDKPDAYDLKSNGVDFDLYLMGNDALDDLGAGFISRIDDPDLDGIQLVIDTAPTLRGAPASPRLP